jgi:hypothetical protein
MIPDRLNKRIPDIVPVVIPDDSESAPAIEYGAIHGTWESEMGDSDHPVSLSVNDTPIGILSYTDDGFGNSGTYSVTNIPVGSYDFRLNFQYGTYASVNSVVVTAGGDTNCGLVLWK